MAQSKEKKDTQHVLVCTRVRPFNSMETECGARNCVELQGKDVIVKVAHGTKKYTYDRVFGMDSKQEDVYNTVISPMIEEIMQGYNCTVFAYGQTGTGKTYTMVGNDDAPNHENMDDPHLGIIPRTLDNLFTTLSANADVDFTVRVSYLELYNEILIDLLSNDEKVLKIFEDQKSKGSVRVHGLEEETIFSKKQVFDILQKGSQKRMTAGTLMNTRSSRSHTVFTITLHSRELTPEGEELVKTGKLNLVDLAGSENITKSGATEKRAKEAGSINQSLLTLGRVIKALVDNSSHIPYRESKLTRILQDSLGGKTKTAIIATISPASSNLEETLSTLDYAFRARNITNRPEINQRMSKKALIQKYLEEIDHLKKDLTAARTQHGIYMNPENYESLMANEKKQKEELYKTVEQCSIFESRYKEVKRMKEELEECCNVAKSDLAHTNEELEKCRSLAKMYRRERRIHQKLIDIYDEAQTALHEYSKRLSEHLDLAVRDQRLLVTKVQNFYSVMDGNEKFTQDFAKNFEEKHEVIDKYFKDAMQSLTIFSDDMMAKIINNAEITKGVFLSFNAALDHFKLLVDKMSKDTRESIENISSQCIKGINNTNFVVEDILVEKNEMFQAVGSNLREDLANISNLLTFYQNRVEIDKNFLKGQFDSLRSDLQNHTRSNEKNFEKFCKTIKSFIDVMEPTNKKLQASSDIISKKYMEIEEDISQKLDELSIEFAGKVNSIKESLHKEHCNSFRFLINEQKSCIFGNQTGMSEFLSKMLNKLTEFNLETRDSGELITTQVDEIRKKVISGQQSANQFAADLTENIDKAVQIVEDIKSCGTELITSKDDFKITNNEVIESIEEQRDATVEKLEESSVMEDGNLNVTLNVAIRHKAALEDNLKYIKETADERNAFRESYLEDHALQFKDLLGLVNDYVGTVVFPKRQGDTPKAKQALQSATPKKVSKSLLAQLMEEEPDSETDTTDSL